MKKKFDNINSIRLLLALVVLCLHFEAYKKHNGLRSILNDSSNLFVIGEIAVYFFFTISGFLIGYNLISEKAQTNSVSLKRFYTNRALRIWPLYYLAIVLYWFVLPHTVFGNILDKFPAHIYANSIIMQNKLTEHTALLLYLFFLPQIASLNAQFSGSSMYPAPHLWSIGVEEVFYLLIPLFILFTRNILKKLTQVTIFYFAFPILLTMIYKLHNSKIIFALLFSIFMHPFCCMLLGVIGSYLYYYHPDKIVRYCNKKSALVCTILILIMLYKSLYFYWFIPAIYCLLFSVVLLYLVQHKINILSLNFIDYLGKISYGIYIYHNISIAIIIFLLKQNHFTKLNFISSIPLILVILLTVLMSVISYEFIEKRFLQLKRKG